MVVSKQEVFLTPEERRAVWAAIFSNKGHNDRNPEVIIQEDYEGNVEAYLVDMAKWHEVPIGKKT